MFIKVTIFPPYWMQWRSWGAWGHEALKSLPPEPPPWKIQERKGFIDKYMMISVVKIFPSPGMVETHTIFFSGYANVRMKWDQLYKMTIWSWHNLTYQRWLDLKNETPLEDLWPINNAVINKIRLLWLICKFGYELSPPNTFWLTCNQDDNNRTIYPYYQWYLSSNAMCL